MRFSLFIGRYTELKWVISDTATLILTISFNKSWDSNKKLFEYLRVYLSTLLFVFRVQSPALCFVSFAFL